VPTTAYPQQPPAAATVPTSLVEPKATMLGTHADRDSGGAAGLARFAVPVGDSRPADSRAAEFHPVVERARISAAPSAQPADELSVISQFVDRVLSGDMTAGAPASAGAAERSIDRSIERSIERAIDALPSRSPAAAAPARAPAAQSDPLGGCLETMYARLIEQEVAGDLADRIIRDVRAELSAAVDAGAIPSERVVREAVERRIAALLPEESADGSIAFGGRIVAGRSGARRIAFVGPTGVGKTTTLAKLAAQLKLKQGLSVGIVAADTYRIAAVDQLRTYAEILEVPVEIAASPADAAEACEALQAEHSVDVILIDTAGRSQNDRMKLSELRAFLKAAQPDETHLVLSATAGARTLTREAEAFGALGVDKLILTKLDEAATFGTLISLVERLGKRVSFFTHGQEVPEHIEIGRSRRLAELVMGHEVR
jgi:flagellar biosynthesis protein FlhF